MRIRAAIAASTIATSMVLGGASAALAHSKDHKIHGNGRARYHACHLYAGVIRDVGPVYSESCKGGSFGW